MAPLLSTPLLLRTQSDRRLVTLASDGHDRAFEVIVERYRRPLQRYLRRLLSEGLAEDVLQATFVRAWQALGAGTEVRDLRPWLYRIAHNQALNTLRAAGAALPAATEDFPAVSLEAHVERREELRETLDGIQALPERQRAALLAVAVADRPHADVAAELGMSDGALRQLLLRARTTLRAAASALTPYPLVTWLAGGQEVSAARVAEVAAGAGGAGVAIKAGAAMLAAGALVAGGPALRGDHAPARAKAAPESAQAHRPSAPRHAAAVTAPTASADHQAGDQAAAPAAKRVRAPARQKASSGHGGSGHSGDDSGSEGAGSGGSASSGAGSGESGSGTTGSGESGSGKSGATASGDDHSGSSGSGSSGSSGDGDSGERGEAIETAPAPVVHGEDTSGSGDGTTVTTGSTDGSGSSGSGGDGSSGDGSSGHGSGGD